jgi:predicted metal-dependent peptidase
MRAGWLVVQVAGLAHTGRMTQPTVVETVLIEVDAEGRVTEDRTQAVGGEVIETLSDGTSRSTLFTIDPSAAQQR